MSTIARRQRNFPPTSSTAFLVACKIMGNPEKPGRESSSGFITLSRAKHSQKRFLSQIFCRSSIMHQMEKESHEAILVPNNQLFKRGVVTRSDFQH
jgi:hypothetical protein